jgi:hypothetical protein
VLMGEQLLDTDMTWGITIAPTALLGLLLTSQLTKADQGYRLCCPLLVHTLNCHG